MTKSKASIPVNPMASGSGLGISIERISFDNFTNAEIEAARQMHRHDGHSFVLLGSGNVTLEIDFKKFDIEPMTMVYVHPDQVHRTIVTGTVSLSVWTIMDDCLNPEYLKILQELMPTDPVPLSEDVFGLVSEAMSVCLKLSERSHDPFYRSVMRDSCNSLVGMVISHFMDRHERKKAPSRFEVVYKNFKKNLEKNFLELKRPADFSGLANVSTHYLNECVRQVTGFPVSYHIQQRVILEAKRLLVHTDLSVKEIASQLGYDDHPYFSRLFNKVAGVTPIAFRGQNSD